MIIIVMTNSIIASIINLVMEYQITFSTWLIIAAEKYFKFVDLL